MKYEFHAEYPLALQDSVTQALAVEWLAGKSDRLPPSWRSIGDIQDPFQKIGLLSQAIATVYKEQARMGTRREAGGFRYWLERSAASFLQTRYCLLEKLGIISTLPDLAALPPGAWAIRFTFTLRKPYLSRDDTDWYILDNPVRKDKVFSLPLVAPTGWKGALRAAMRQEKGYVSWEQEDEQMVRLFGHVKGEEREEAFRAGRLHFYPTFFTQLGLEVINPHDRQTGSGRQPIYIECVPAGAKSSFSLLYVLFDLIGRKSEDEIKREAKADLKLITEAISAMMLTYGFSAKRTSGYGTAEDEIAGVVQTRVGEWKLTRLSRFVEEVANVEF